MPKLVPGYVKNLKIKYLKAQCLDVITSPFTTQYLKMFLKLFIFTGKNKVQLFSQKGKTNYCCQRIAINGIHTNKNIIKTIVYCL